MDTTIYPTELCLLVSQVCLYMDHIGQWPNALERHAALEDVGSAFGPYLSIAMDEAAIARAALGETRP